MPAQPDKTEVKPSTSETEGPKAPTGEALEGPLFTFGDYHESKDWVPDPMAVTGTVDTSGTAGNAGGSVDEASSIFAVARAQTLRQAARALDPADTDVPAELVTLPTGAVTVTGTTKTPDEARDEVFRAVEAAAAEPVVIGGMTRDQELASRADESREGTDRGETGTVEDPCAKREGREETKATGRTTAKAEEKSKGTWGS